MQQFLPDWECTRAMLVIWPVYTLVCVVAAITASIFSRQRSKLNTQGLHDQLTALEKLIFIEDANLDREEWVRDIHRRFHACHLALNAEQRLRSRSRNRAKLGENKTQN